MKKFKLLIATIWLIGCSNASIDIPPTYGIYSDKSIEDESKLFAKYQSSLLSEVGRIHEQVFQDQKLGRIVEFFAEPLTVLFNNDEFRKAFYSQKEGALETSLRTLIYSPESYKHIFSQELYGRIFSRLRSITKERKNGVFWIYFSALAPLYWR